MFKYGRRMDPRLNLGDLFMLKTQKKSKPRVLTRTLDFILRDHSSLSQRCG
jgi:hypothetical protein